MLFSVICFVDLGPDRSNLLAAALERVGITAVLRQPPGTGAVVLCRFSAAGLETLYTPVDPHSLDLRSWVLAARAIATGARHDGSPAGDAFKALTALDALLSADASWLSGVEECMVGGGCVSCTLLCSAPASPVDAATLEAALKAADERFWAVNFAVVAPTTPAELDAQEERAVWQASLASVVAASDNGGYRAVPCTPAAAEELAFALLIPNEPDLQATLSFPAALSGGKCRVRLTLRPTILPLRDGVELVRLCNCHGRPLLNSATALVCDCPFVKARGESYTCAISGKTLKQAGDIHPNAIAIGDGVLQLPSFLSLPWLGSDAEDGRAGAAFSALACVTLASVSESQLFGAPFTAHAVEDEEEPSPPDASNAALVEALRVTLHRRDCGLLLAGTVSLDTGGHAMFRCLYLAMPSAEPHGGLMLKRIASREEVLPPSQACATEVPPALAQEVALSLTAMLPDTPFDSWSHERGMHQLLKQVINPSLAPPPRGAMHNAEAEAMEARERASRGRKQSSKSKK